MEALRAAREREGNHQLRDGLTMSDPIQDALARIRDLQTKGLLLETYLYWGLR